MQGIHIQLPSAYPPPCLGQWGPVPLGVAHPGGALAIFCFLVAGCPWFWDGLLTLFEPKTTLLGPPGDRFGTLGVRLGDPGPPRRTPRGPEGKKVPKSGSWAHSRAPLFHPKSGYLSPRTLKKGFRKSVKKTRGFELQNGSLGTSKTRLSH